MFTLWRDGTHHAAALCPAKSSGIPEQNAPTDSIQYMCGTPHPNMWSEHPDMRGVASHMCEAVC